MVENITVANGAMNPPEAASTTKERSAAPPSKITRYHTMNWDAVPGLLLICIQKIRYLFHRLVMTCVSA